jgi:hypothetical protein
VADDDREVMERLAALEAEVKADADAQRARKEAALAKLREQRAAKQAEVAVEREREVALVKRKPARGDPAGDLDAESLRGALELAGKANKVKQELSKKGAKSWAISGVASVALGPLGWLYAGSFREAIPASAIWLVIATLVSKIGLPGFLLTPALLITLPLSGIAGVMYALQYNKTHKRQRLFASKEQKQLAAAKAAARGLPAAKRAKSP